MSEPFDTAVDIAADGAVLAMPPLGRGRLRRDVWSLSWPVILSFALDSILGLTSMLMVGRLGAQAVGAVGLGSQVLGAVRSGIGAVGTGTVALVARDIGGGDRDYAEEGMEQLAIFGVLISTLI